MNNEQNIVYVQSQILCAYAEIEKMKAQNLIDSEIDHREPTYSPDDFEKIPYRYGIDHNQVITVLVE